MAIFTKFTKAYHIYPNSSQFSFKIAGSLQNSVFRLFVSNEKSTFDLARPLIRNLESRGSLRYLKNHKNGSSKIATIKLLTDLQHNSRLFFSQPFWIVRVYEIYEVAKILRYSKSFSLIEAPI